MSGRGPLILDNARHGLVGLGSSDEDPYSVAGSGSSGSSGNGNRWQLSFADILLQYPNISRP